MGDLKAQGATLNGTEFSSFSKFVPESVKFKPIRAGIAARRTPVKFPSEQQSYSTSTNRQIRFILPNNATYDTRKGYVTMDVAISNATGTYVRVHQGIFSLLNRFRSLVGPTEIEDLRDYNRLYAFLWEMLNPSLVTGNIGPQMGFDTQVNRNAKGAATTSYVLPLFSGVLNTELLPFKAMNNGLILELYLENATACLESDSPTTPIITVSNLKFHCERLELEDSYESTIYSEIRSNGLTLGFQTWERYINALTTGTSHQLQINHRSSSVNGLIHFLLQSSEFNDMTVNDKFLNWLPLTLNSSSLNINGAIFPDEPVELTSSNLYIEAYQMYCRWIMKWNLNGILAVAPPINQAAFAVNRFIIIDDLEPYPEVMDIINPFTTLGNAATLLKKLIFTAGPAAGYELDTWVEYFRQIKIYSDGSVKVLQ